MSVTLSLFAGVGAQFLDNNGAILSGGLIYTYTAGTTTPLATYTSNLGTVAQPNPIVLDSAGRIPGGELWLTTGYGYKFVTKDSNNVLIGTYDNVPSSAQPPITNDSSSISYESGYVLTAGSFIVGNTYVIASIGTTNFQTIGATSNTVGLSFIATGVGSGTGTAQASITVQTKLRESISVFDGFNVKGDGTTDDTVALQNAIDYCLQNDIPILRFPGKNTYITSNTLQLGYGVNSFSTLVLEGDSKQKTIIKYVGTPDRPAINIQGGRSSGVKNLAINREYDVSGGNDFYTIQNMCYSGVNIQRKANIANWIETGAVVSFPNPFCGICIDGYGNSYPATYHYPAVSYPSWLGTGIPQYNKSSSSQCIIENCSINGFFVGLAISPNNAGNGDYTVVDYSNFAFCCYGITSGNQNGRLLSLHKTQFGPCYIGISNKAGYPYGLPAGSSGFHFSSASLNEYGYQMFDIICLDGIVIIDCYSEGLTLIGSIYSGAAAALPVQFIGCSFIFARTGTDGSSYVPPSIFVGYGKFVDCFFNAIYGIEFFDDVNTDGAFRLQFENCYFNNTFEYNNFPTASAPESVGMLAVSMIVIGPTSNNNPRFQRILGACRFTYNYANIQDVYGEDTNTGSNVYTASSSFWNTSLDYYAPAYQAQIFLLLSSISVSGQTLTASTAGSTYPPKVGDVLYIKSSNNNYVLLVQTYNSGAQTITALICTNYSKDSTSTITINQGTPSAGYWNLYRAAPYKLSGDNFMSINCTSASNVVTLNDRSGNAIADATLYYSTGQTLMICPVNYALPIFTPPFAGPVEITNVTAGNITVNQTAKISVVIPATPCLAKV